MRNSSSPLRMALNFSWTLMLAAKLPCCYQVAVCGMGVKRGDGGNGDGGHGGNGDGGHGGNGNGAHGENGNGAHGGNRRISGEAEQRRTSQQRFDGSDGFTSEITLW